VSVASVLMLLGAITASGSWRSHLEPGTANVVRLLFGERE